MNKQFKITLCLVMVCLSISTFAKTKKKPVKTHFKQVEAYTQRTLPGIPGAEVPPAVYHFVMVWLGTGNLETCFWRGENGWMTCKVEKAHKINPKDARNYPPGLDYVTDEVTETVHKGDTLMLTPIRGGKFAIPKEIPATAKNTLFYKTAGSKWLSFPVTTITKKKDIPMP